MACVASAAASAYLAHTLLLPWDGGREGGRAGGREVEEASGEKKKSPYASHEGMDASKAHGPVVGVAGLAGSCLHSQGRGQLSSDKSGPLPHRACPLAENSRKTHVGALAGPSHVESLHKLYLWLARSSVAG